MRDGDRSNKAKKADWSGRATAGKRVAGPSNLAKRGAND